LALNVDGSGNLFQNVFAGTRLVEFAGTVVQDVKLVQIALLPAQTTRNCTLLRRPTFFNLGKKRPALDFARSTVGRQTDNVEFFPAERAPLEFIHALP
jgi:hypothetical protein